MACYRRYRGETTLERQVREELELRGVTFVQEGKVGRYSVDFLLTRERLALEVDGTYWHRDPARDQRKGMFLILNGWDVVRLSDKDIKKHGAAVCLDRILKN